MFINPKCMAAAIAALAAGAGAGAIVVALRLLLARDCVFSAQAEPGDTCKSMAEAWFITESQFISYNPGVNCAALTAGREYCVEWTGKLPPTSSVPTTTKISSTSTTTVRVTSSPSKTTTTSSTTKTTTSAPAGPTPTQDGIAKDCNSWHLVQSGDTCQKIVDKYKTFSLSQFCSWNPAVGTDCSSLWLDYYVCIGIKGGTTPKPTTTTTTKTTTAKATTTTPAGPTPTQPNVTNKCKKWHLVKSGDTCQKVSDSYKITLANFYVWNPDVGSTCASLWLDYYVCVGV